MPLWRCPHCGTPQVESSRCWVCRRSTTSCAACRHFRRGIAGGLGLCGLDPRRVPLRGTEMRACWEAAETTGTLSPIPVPALAAAGGRTGRTFVPVDGPETPAGAPYSGVAVMATDEDRAPAPAARPRRIPGGWSLWGDFEP